MNTKAFNRIIERQLERCKSVLVDKAMEYATEDRLHNFKVAAELQGVTPMQALAGMMAKHTVSVYDMCAASRMEEFPTALWYEKITDSINYLLLLRAMVAEEAALIGDSVCMPCSRPCDGECLNDRTCPYEC